MLKAFYIEKVLLMILWYLEMTFKSFINDFFKKGILCIKLLKLSFLEIFRIK